MPHNNKPHRLLHTMLRVRNLDTSLDFYTEKLGMRILRREDYSDGKFTLVFLGYEDESDATVLELTHNWQDSDYNLGSAYGHIALAISDIYAFCTYLEAQNVIISRAPGPMAFGPSEIIAFIVDPDGYKIGLIEKN
ncbi:MAG: lactoylglutathione lyase [Emcibacteraceae bacterium]|nr:lactoylglutathione lyase [Emcibacteraceae bacterium]